MVWSGCTVDGNDLRDLLSAANTHLLYHYEHSNRNILGAPSRAQNTFHGADWPMMIFRTIAAPMAPSARKP